MTGREDSSASLRPVALPLAGSFVATVWVMVLVCRFQLESRLTWRELFAFVLVVMVVAALVHAFAVTVARGIVERREDLSAWRLMYSTWIPVVWMPALVALAMDRSVWVAFLLPAMAAMIAALMHRWGDRDAVDTIDEGEVQSLFRVPPGVAWERTIGPLLPVSLAAQVGIVALLARWDWVAGLLLALACLLPLRRLWRRKDAKPRVWSAVASTVAALLVTTLALVPFLKPGRGALAMAELLRMQRLQAAMAKSKAPAPGAGYSGIILTLPPKPREAVLPPASSPDVATERAKPTVIRFDGVYWYFKEPDERPRFDARLVQGDPLKAQIQSTNTLALRMEAHQAVLPAVQLSCCGVVDVNVVNADTRYGSIWVEVLLRDTETKGKAAVSLGSIMLASSLTGGKDLQRAPVHETLAFHIPPSARTGQFDEITVRIKPSWERSLAASQVSVESFALVP